MLMIRLLGHPRLERDGAALPSPRGAKSWALLGRLVRSPDPIPRERLVEELFADAEDPLGALRWSLAELRRRTGLPDAFTGNPVAANLGDDVVVDIAELSRGVLGDAAPEGRFLEGVDPRGSATFESWLMIERQRVDNEVLAALRRHVLRALPRHDYAYAIALAGAMVQRDPRDEGSHVLLIKALAMSGDHAAAAAQAATTEAVMLRELGVEASPAVRAAVREAPPGPLPSVSARATAETLLEAGRAALGAGAADAGVECVRGSIPAAEASGDLQLLATCLLELGTAFVHSVRGYDDEGMVVLEEAVETATRAGDPSIAARAQAELGYVDLLAGRRLSADQRLALARRTAGEDSGVLAVVAAFEGCHLHDWGLLDESLARFEESRARAHEVGDLRREAWALGLGSRTMHALRRFAEAERWAVTSTAITIDEKWPAFRPWAQSWIALSRLSQGADPLAVRAELEGAFAMSCQLKDACWEGISAKAIAVTYDLAGDPEQAVRWLGTAAGSCSRVNDAYSWVSTDVTISEAEIRLAQGIEPEAGRLAYDGVTAAAKFDMPMLRQRGEHVLDAIGEHARTSETPRRSGVVVPY